MTVFIKLIAFLVQKLLYDQKTQLKLLTNSEILNVLGVNDKANV